MKGFIRVENRGRKAGGCYVGVLGRHLRMSLACCKELKSRGYTRVNVFVKEDGSEVCILGDKDGNRKISSVFEFLSDIVANTEFVKMLRIMNPYKYWRFNGVWEDELNGFRFVISDENMQKEKKNELE